MGADYQGSSSVDNFFVPTESAEQVERNNQQRELNAAQLSIVQEVSDDFTEIFNEARDIDNLDPKSKISLEAQIAGMQFARKWAESKAKKWQSMLVAKQDSLTGAGVGVPSQEQPSE